MAEHSNSEPVIKWFRAVRKPFCCYGLKIEEQRVVGIVVWLTVSLDCLNERKIFFMYTTV
jgi:hypothetical protein